MRISHGTRFKTSANHNGYGYATEQMLASLERLGYQTSQNDATADVEIWFDQPHHWNFSEGPYKIGYHPWESTELQEGWVEIMNQCDEIWTPSPLIAKWYKEAGITVPVFVYEHGVDHIWKPVERTGKGRTFNFLHVGTEAARKGGWDVYRAFNKAFPSDPNVRLTLKMVSQNWLGMKKLGRTHFINSKFNINELVHLFNTSHAYVYPSWGEGFGLTPLQAMATGMPTISVPAWAPYADYMDPDLNISSELTDSKWPKIHPGKMLKPDLDELVDRMRYVRYNYTESQQFAYKKAQEIHKIYDWDRITKQVFEDLESRIKS